MVCKSALFDAFLQLGLYWTFAADQEKHVGDLPADFSDGVDQAFQPHATAQAANRQKDRAVCRKFQGQPGLRWGDRRLENSLGYPAWNDVDAVARDAVSAFQ